MEDKQEHDMEGRNTILSYGDVSVVISDKCKDQVIFDLHERIVKNIKYYVFNLLLTCLLLQLEKTLEERSISVRLHPRLADNCRRFLADACIEMSGPGEEMECLEVERMN